MTDPAETMFANLEEKTGKPKDFWLDAVHASGLSKHGEIIAFLKAEHGIGHGYANLIAHTAKGSAAAAQAPDDLVAGQYAGKEDLRPIYEGLKTLIEGFGPDVDVAPKKAGVSFRRKKQFALVEPKTRTRVDVGINLKGHPGTDRLKVAGGMCTHKVGLTDAEEVDAELTGWLREAYEAAG